MHARTPAVGQRLTASQLTAMFAFPIGATPVAGTISATAPTARGTAIVVQLDAGSGMANNETSVVVR